MFTVLHKDGEGVETLYTVNHVQFVPMTPDNGDSGGVHMLCGPTEAAHGVHVGRLKEGTVFVMNAAGSTIATYRLATLDKSQWPKEQAKPEMALEREAA